MGGTGVIDHFLEVFTRYIDGGFGLLQPEVGFIATTLIVIDVTLAALFWSWGADENIIARLVKKTLFVGVFAYLIGNWNNLAKIVRELTPVYGEDGPVAVIYRASWPDQLILTGTLATIRPKVKAAGITRTALISLRVGTYSDVTGVMIP